MGHSCDCCDSTLDSNAFLGAFSWDYECPKCGFVYRHNGVSSAEQVVTYKKDRV